MSKIRLAYDRSSRAVDADGRLHVAVNRLTCATVSPYLGSEVPDAQKLGLDPDRIYQILRPAEELRKAAPTFRNIPLLSEHVPVSAADHRPDLVIGSTGSDVKFEGPWLVGSLVIWAADAIAAIQSGERRDLSAAYRYRAVREVGTFNGQPYTLKMVDIAANHIAAVPEGRVPGAVVGDAAPTFTETTMPDVSRVIEALRGKLNPEDLAEIIKLLTDGDDIAADDPPPWPGTPRPPSDPRHPSIYPGRTTMDSTTRRAVRALQAVQAAQQDVAPTVGHIAADSAEGVYLEALRRMGHRTAGLHPTGAKPIFEALRSRRRQGGAYVSMDAASEKSYAERFPHAARILRG